MLSMLTSNRIELRLGQRDHVVREQLLVARVVERLERILIDRNAAHADVIVVRADRDVLVLEHRIAPGITATTLRAHSLGSSTKSSDAVTLPPVAPSVRPLSGRPKSCAAAARVSRMFACGMSCANCATAAAAASANPVAERLRATASATAARRGRRRLRRDDRNVDRGARAGTQRIEIDRRHRDRVGKA